MEQIKGTISKLNENEKTITIAPRTKEELYCVNFSGESDILSMTQQMHNAQVKWAKLTNKSRIGFLHKYYQLLEINRQKIVDLIVLENGKLEHEANAEVNKALELTEFALSIPSLLNGKSQFVSRGIEVKEVIEPIGNVLIVTPFNFPMMIPHWNLLNILVTGNGAIIKPSTQTPKTIQLVIQLLIEAGVPEGLVNIAYGEEKVVQSLISNEHINAVTFVGSTPVAEKIYQMSTHAGKRVIALGGAKNHTIIMNDVNMDVVSSEIIESAFGMAGQRCMATSVLSVVGKNNEIVNHVIEKLAGVKEIAPIVNNQARDKIYDYVESTNNRVLVNGLIDSEGRKHESNCVMPTIIEFSDSNDMHDEEIFGPLLEVVYFETLDEAIEFQNKSRYANGATIYTTNGANASEAIRLSSGMIGVNVGVPVPREPYGFAGLKNSKYGYGDISGINSLDFLINKKKITTKWNHENKVDWTS